MNRDNNFTLGFTLLELVVVLAILAVVTAIATRSLGKLEDQRRYEASQRGLEELEVAVLGSDDDRAPDGTPMIGGFVADMGRLPRTVGSPDLTLAELWLNPNPGVVFDARRFVGTNRADPLEIEDTQVLVPGGWRGPYLRLPLGAGNLLDGWGNAYRSSTNPLDDPSLARLRDVNDQAIITVDQPIVTVRHLGANGAEDSYTEGGYDRDQKVVFDQINAQLSGSIELLDDGEAVAPIPGTKVVVKVYAPDPSNPAKIVVYKSDATFDDTSGTYEIPSAGLTIGTRVVRACLTDDPGTTVMARSSVKTVVLRPGMNFQKLRIDR